MIGIHQDLLKRAEAGKPVRFAVIGAGQMGVDIVSQTGQMTGMEVTAVVPLYGFAAARLHPGTYDTLLLNFLESVFGGTTGASDSAQPLSKGLQAASE